MANDPTDRRLPRRTIIKAAIAGAALVVPAALGVRGAYAASSKLLDLGTATAATFKPYVGQRFLLEGSATSLKLARVRSSRADAFSLDFDGPPTTQQGTYVLSHNKLGRFALFIVPHQGPSYEAVINHQTTV